MKAWICVLRGAVVYVLDYIILCLVLTVFQ
jgi:hypothetical protein